MIRKTRLMGRGGVLLVRVETFQGRTLRSTRFQVSTLARTRTFPGLDAALDAFRTMNGQFAVRAQLKAA